MDHPFEHIVDLIVAILIVFIFPLLYFGQKKDVIVQTLVETETSKFVEDIRSKGYLDKDMYEEYLGQLSATGLLYDITMEHNHQSLEPEYRFRTEEEILKEQENAYTGENNYTYRPVHTDIPYVEDPIGNSGSLNTETNESILAGAVRTPPAADHIHSDACYSGHKHIDHATYTYMHQHTYECTEYVDVRYLSFDCRTCGRHNDFFVLAVYWWNEETQSVQCSYSTDGIWCMGCGGTDLTNLEPHNSYSYSCGYTVDLDGDGYTDQVGRDRAYEYQVSYPPGDSRITVTSGCYTYHRTNDAPVYLRDYYGTPIYKKDVFWNIIYNGYNYYCSIPQYYEFRLEDDDDTYYVIYEAVLTETGQVELRYDSASFTWFHDCDYPRTITWTEAAHLTYSSSLQDFFLEHTNIPRYYIRDDMQTDLNLSAELDICPIDHDYAHSNKWFLSCGQEEEDTTADCSQIVTSITPTNPIQTVYTNDPLITTVNATYLDGSSYIVEATASFSTANVVEDQTVTLTYINTVDSVSTTHTCEITVTVIPRSKTCSHGHTYNLNPDGTDPGCPFCRAYLSKLEIVHPSTGRIEIYKGTTLEENGVVLLATYMDGRTEYIYTGYVDNLDLTYVGTQNVTISYKGKYVSLTVITKKNLTLCPVCGHYYELYSDNSDPGCPYCDARTPIFTGNVLEYDSKVYEADILKEIYDGSGTYYFTVSDYFEVTVGNITRGFGNRILGAFIKGLSDRSIHVVSGGYIREETRKKYR